jgi:hypothetical protein
VSIRPQRVRTLHSRGLSGRHLVAFHIVDSQTSDLRSVTEALAAALIECEVLDIEPLRDPAVLLLTTHLSLLASSELHSRHYSKLARICFKEAQNEYNETQH